MVIKKLAHFSPGRFIFFSVSCMILIGTALLALPIARTLPMSFLDLFFTATSATCVTGLFTVPLTNFTTFGHTVILILSQIGGLGLITLTIFIMSLFVNLGFTTQLMAVKLFDLESWHNIKKLIMFIICFTLTIELVGAICVFLVIRHDYPFTQALFLSIFHAVTSFCNAGITLFTDGMQHYNTNYCMLITTMLLIVAGGLGFLTWHELLHYVQERNTKRWHMLSLNTKIILYGSTTLIILGTVVIFLLEYNHAFASMSPFLAGINALFQAVSARSAGFLTVDLHTLHIATLFFIILNAFIGAAPASTASGIKITTFAVYLATIKAAIFGRTSVEIKGRSIGSDQAYKAIAIVALSITWVLATTFLLLITEPTLHFSDLLFEAFSAFATLGLSAGITASLSIPGKIVIMMSMIIGRIGSLTLILALRELRYRKKETTGFSYPEERVLLS